MHGRLQSPRASRLVRSISSPSSSPSKPSPSKTRIDDFAANRMLLHPFFSNFCTEQIQFSALQLKYREILRAADCSYKPESYATRRVKFVCLKASADLISERMKRRSSEGKHWQQTEKATQHQASSSATAASPRKEHLGAGKKQVGSLIPVAELARIEIYGGLIIFFSM
jgi:hypothetical protein